jgi:hypothetical protein
MVFGSSLFEIRCVVFTILNDLKSGKTDYVQVYKYYRAVKVTSSSPTFGWYLTLKKMPDSITADVWNLIKTWLTRRNSRDEQYPLYRTIDKVKKGRHVCNGRDNDGGHSFLPPPQKWWSHKLTRPSTVCEPVSNSEGYAANSLVDGPFARLCISV